MRKFYFKYHGDQAKDKLEGIVILELSEKEAIDILKTRLTIKDFQQLVYGACFEEFYSPILVDYDYLRYYDRLHKMSVNNKYWDTLIIKK